MSADDTWIVPDGSNAGVGFPGIDSTPAPIPHVGGRAQPVLTMPVAGPSPFNTLAVVRGRWVIGVGVYADGELRRGTTQVPTRLRIPGFDPRRPVAEQVTHSTSASLLAISSGPQHNPENDAGSTFVIAIDRVVAEPVVHSDGSFAVNVEFGTSRDQVSAADFIEISSWVLFVDPEQDRERADAQRRDADEVRRRILGRGVRVPGR